MLLKRGGSCAESCTCGQVCQYLYQISCSDYSYSKHSLFSGACMLQKLMISISHHTQISNIDSSVDDPDEVVFEWQDVLKDVLLKVSLDKISILFPLFQACTSFQDGVFQGTDIQCIDQLLVECKCSAQVGLPLLCHV